MPQQVNLWLPILLSPKHYFSARTMARALGIFAVVGGGLCAYMVLTLQSASDNLKPTLVRQVSEMQSLQSTLSQRKAGGAGLGPVLARELLVQRAALSAREKVLVELQRRLIVPGAGYAARLQLVARSIPSQVWVTEVSANENRLEVKGFTLLPSALNDWSKQLALSPLLGGQKLMTVKVDIASDPGSKYSDPLAVSGVPSVPPSSPAQGRPTWSFSMVSAVGPDAALVEAKP